VVRVLLIVDETVYDPRDPGFLTRRPPKYLAAEFHVAAALRQLGAKVTSIPATNRVDEAVRAIRQARPDLAFNLVEHIDGHRTSDSVVAAILETVGVAYTGASAKALTIARDKYLSKVIVASSGVPVPVSFVAKPHASIRTERCKFPVLIKPLCQDGSEGITARSLCTNIASLRRQAQRLFDEFGGPGICEEFIEGREIYVTLSGISRTTIDSVCEMIFPQASRVKFASQRVKFDDDYRKMNGIYFASPPRLTSRQLIDLHFVARSAYEALEIASYAKLEFRLRGDTFYFYEANPNSNLSRFSNATDFAKINYPAYIEKIVRMAIKRHKLRHRA
jgi:D-alanine-D-alanine ligase